MFHFFRWIALRTCWMLKQIHMFETWPKSALFLVFFKQQNKQTMKMCECKIRKSWLPFWKYAIDLVTFDWVKQYCTKAKGTIDINLNVKMKHNTKEKRPHLSESCRLVRDFFFSLCFSSISSWRKPDETGKRSNVAIGISSVVYMLYFVLLYSMKH